jgi:hypothetical protein
MTGLHGTPLTTSQEVECAAKALAGKQVHGTVSALGEQFGPVSADEEPQLVACAVAMRSGRQEP